MKVATWKGCKDCPYNLQASCTKFGLNIRETIHDGAVTTYRDLETPHPNCKLNDLPSSEDAVKWVVSSTINNKITSAAKVGVELGADYILNKINGS